MLYKMDRSRQIAFLVILGLALCCFAVLIYHLWAISFDTNEDYELYEGGLEEKKLKPNHHQYSTIKQTPRSGPRPPMAATTPASLHRNSHLFNSENCGSITQHVSRIIKGEIAPILSNPWMVALFHHFKSTDSTEFNCGGSLISENLILTAAHCVIPDRPVKIRLGEQNLITDPDCETESNQRICADAHQDITDFEIVPHEDYLRAFPTDQDIALIRLKTPAKLHQNNINTICLPFEPIEKPAKREMMEVIGFGRLENGSRSDLLMTANVPFVTIEECRRIFTKGIYLDNGNICAGGNEADSCKGDSGGPLQVVRLINDRPKQVQFGIVSAGPKDAPCGQSPGIYTRVDTYLNWILDNAGF